ncbi:MAG: hypothetical protein ACXW2C_07380 [Acidimicrobiia bacterium]
MHPGAREVKLAPCGTLAAAIGALQSWVAGGRRPAEELQVE